MPAMPDRYRFTREDCCKGGRATASKRVAAWTCPHCPHSFQNVPQLALSGHLGLHSFADRYAGGDLRLAAEKLGLCGQAATDPVPENGAFARAHQALAEVRARRKQLLEAEAL